MAGRGTLLRFELELEARAGAPAARAEFTLAAHASETGERIVLRALAHALEHAPDLVVGPPLCRDDEPVLGRRNEHARWDPWIEVGEPDPARLRRALSAADRLVVVSSGASSAWRTRMREFRWPKKAQLELVEIEPALVRALGARLERTNRWRIALGAGSLELASGAQRCSGSCVRSALGG